MNNKTLITLFIVFFGLLLFLNHKVDEQLNPSGTTTEKNCTRTERYQNLAVYDSALTLIEERIRNWYGKEGIAGKLITIIPCIVIIEENVKRNKEGAEGYFVFGGEGVSPNYLPIYVDSSYHKTDTLLTASLIIHEMAHAWQYIELVNGRTSGRTNTESEECYDREIVAFLAQSDFFRTLNYVELQYLADRIRYDLYPHPQINIIHYLISIFLAADDVCDEKMSRKLGGWTECVLTLQAHGAGKMVKDHPHYQKQCEVN